MKKPFLGGWAGPGWEALPGPPRGPHPLFCLSIIESRAEPLTGRRGLQCWQGHRMGTGDLGWVGQQVPPAPDLRSQQQTCTCRSVSFLFLTVSFHSFSFLKHPYSYGLSEQSQGQLTKGSESQDRFYLRTSPVLKPPHLDRVPGSWAPRGLIGLRGEDHSRVPGSVLVRGEGSQR